MESQSVLSRIHRMNPYILLLLVPLLFAFLSFIGLFPSGRAIMITPIPLTGLLGLALDGIIVAVPLAIVEMLFLRDLVIRPTGWILATVIGVAERLTFWPLGKKLVNGFASFMASEFQV